jgi:hypothetical protein
MTPLPAAVDPMALKIDGTYLVHRKSSQDLQAPPYEIRANR